jgi:hypothetical protein
MRPSRFATAIAFVLLTGLLLAAPAARGWALIGCVLAAVTAIPLAAKRRAGRNSTLVPWAVSFVVSAAVCVPLLISGSYTSVGAHVFVGLILWVALAASVRLVIAGARRVIRTRGALVSWIVSLSVSAIVLVPQLVLEHHRSDSARVFIGIGWWLILAALLRFVIFLADYFRRRLNGVRANA